MLCAMTAFASALRLGLALRCKAAALASRLRYSSLARLLHAWSRAARRQKQLLLLSSKHRAKRSERLLKRALHEWHSVMLLQHQKQRLRAKADYFRFLIVSSSVLAAWRSFLEHRQRKALAVAKATVHFGRAYARRALRAWRLDAGCTTMAASAHVLAGHAS